MGSLVMAPAGSGIGQHSRHPMMVDDDSHRDETHEAASRAESRTTIRAASSASSTPSADTPATPNSSVGRPRNAPRTASQATPVAPSQPVIQEPIETSSSASRTTYPTSASHNMNQHSRGYDQSGFPLTSEPQGLVSSSPSSPRLQPTYRSTRSLGGSEATSPSRIKIRDLSHIQSFASEEMLTRPQIAHRRGSAFSDPGRQYEISAMPVTDIIEMVAGLLTKITTTNDQQHDSVHRPIPPPDDQTTLNPQTSCVLAFHGKNVPSITIMSYLSRIHKYCPTTYEVFLSLLVYFDRMTETVNRGFLQDMNKNTVHSSSEPPKSPMPMNIDPTPAEPAMSTPPASGSMAAAEEAHQSPVPLEPSLHASQGDLSQFFVVDSYNIHRLVIAGVTCASKFFSDVFYTNSRYAKVGGLPLNELNHLELQFLLLNDFRLSVPVEELEAYGTMLVEFYAREIVAQQQAAAAAHAHQHAGHGGSGLYMREHSSPGASQVATPP